MNKSKKPAFAACNSEKPAEPSAAAKSVALPRPTLFTIKGACHDLSLSRTTILRMIELGELQTIRLSQRAIRIPATSIDRLLVAKPPKPPTLEPAARALTPHA